MDFSHTSLSGTVDIPEECTDEFSCMCCEDVTWFTGWTNIMIFEHTSLSGIINIPESCTEYFSCNRCNNIMNIINNHNVRVRQWEQNNF